jgi:hypothetical protein
MAGPANRRAATTAAASKGETLPKFPDFGQLPTPQEFHPARTFKLSQDYPRTQPKIEPAVQRILAIDYTKDWKAYANATLAYVLEGNIEGREMENTFFLEDNKVRRWYHVPWQHWGDNGREGLHGLTSEGPVNPLTLDPHQTDQWQTYAVGFYNDLGGYQIGQVWADPENPRLDAMAKSGFPVGTVVAKILFTTAPVSQAPFLSNPIEWNAYVKTSFSAPGPSGLPIKPRVMSRVRLIQADIMVRDDRAKATGGWVFGTFVYNGAQANINRWNNLVPLGLMWGDDPQVTSHKAGNPAPVATVVNPDLKETVINTQSKLLPPMHLGFGLRLSGPVDNTLSSCKSCHSTAEYPAVSSILPAYAKLEGEGRLLRCGDPQWMLWFRNLKPTEAFDSGARPMDNSLQLAGSIQNFLAARNLSNGGLYAAQYWKGRPVLSVYALRGSVPPGAPPCDKTDGN